MNPSVCVLTVTWNQVEKTLACLETIFSQDYAPIHVLLVDNASQDDTVDQVRDRFPTVEVLPQTHNHGFAGGYNIGLRHALDAGYDQIFLLNNDTLLAPDCLTQLVAAGQAEPAAGLITAKIYYAAERQRLWTTGGLFHPWLLEVTGKGDGQIDQGRWDERPAIEFVPLCAVLLKRHLLATIGLLDETYFVYYEDMDFCYRARQAGIPLRLAPAAHVWHAVSASSGGAGSPAERYWMAQSSGRFFRKFGRGPRLLLIVPYRLASALRTSWRLWRAGRMVALRAYWLGLWRGWSTGRATTPPPPWVK